MGEYLEDLYKPNPNNPVKQALSSRHNFRVIMNRLNELIILVEATTGIIAGTKNIALGDGALYSLTTGHSNVAFGYQALYSNLTGYSNMALGYQALYTNTVGYYNVAIGYQALYSNTNSSYNVAIGYQVLYFNTEGCCNIAIGYQVLYSNTTGDYNTAIGDQALYSNTIGRTNVAIGGNAMRLNINGQQNTAVGDWALGGNIEGDYNIAIGNRALNNAEGNYNTAIGLFTGSSNVSGNKNVFIGSEAGRSETGSEKLYIANSNTATPLIYGEFDNAILAIYGNLGIGTKTFGTNATRTLALFNGTIPATSPANAVQLYAEDVASSSELKVRDEGGTVTILSPHAFELFSPKASDPFPWSYHSVNSFIGKKVNVDMSGALRELEQLTGKQFIFYEDVDKDSVSKHLKEKRKELIIRYIMEHTTELEVSKGKAWGKVQVDVQDVNKILRYDTEYELDTNTGEVKEIKKPVYKKKKVMKNKLRAGYRFDNKTGKFLQRVKPTEAEAFKAIKDKLKLPDWIKERI